MKKNLLSTSVFITATIPLVYLAIIWNSVPETVVLHFNEKMQPDRLGNKAELWIPVGIMSVVSIGVFFLLNNISRFDPKQKTAVPSSTFNKLAAGLVVFMTALSFILIISAVKGSLVLEKFLFPLIG